MSDEEDEIGDDVIIPSSKDGGKMCGYLEKRGKLGVTGRWRRWYCVLDGHLLLQYKSQAEYLSLSPCRGSINMALAKTIQKKPKSLEIHIATRSQVILLKATDEESQTRWITLFIEAMNSHPHQSALTIRLNSHHSSFRSQHSGKHSLQRSFSLDSPSAESDLSDKLLPIISTDGQITFIDEEETDEDEMDVVEKKDIVKELDLKDKVNLKIEKKENSKQLLETGKRDIGEVLQIGKKGNIEVINDEKTDVLKENMKVLNIEKIINVGVLNIEKKETIGVLREEGRNNQAAHKELIKKIKVNEELLDGNVENEESKQISNEAKANNNEGGKKKENKIGSKSANSEEKPKKEKRCLSEKVHILSKVDEEPEETSSMEIEVNESENVQTIVGMKKEELVSNKHDNEHNESVNEIVKEDETRNTHFEAPKTSNISDEITVEENDTVDNCAENIKDKSVQVETNSIRTNSLVPIIIHKNSNFDKNTTDEIRNSEIDDHFDFDENKIQYENDSLLYLHEYLKTYIENNYEVMRAFNKKDKYLNQKIKINNKQNRKQLKNMLLCQCGGPCCNYKQYNVQKRKVQGNIYEIAPISNKPKAKYVWFEDPDSEEEEAYYVYEKSNAKKITVVPEFDQDCAACLEEKRNLDLFDSKCLECISEFKEKCIKPNHVVSKSYRNRFKNVHPERAAKNKAHKIVYENKNILKRSSSEIIGKSLKSKYERNHSIRKRIKKHGIRFDLHDQLAPISYSKVRNASKLYDKFNKNRRYSEELLYTAYLDLELRKKFPDLSRVNNRIVNRSSSLLLSTQNPYRVSSHSKSRGRYGSTDKIYDKSNNDDSDTIYVNKEVSEEMSAETKEYDSIINKHIQELMNPVDCDKDKPDKRTIDELLEEVKTKEKIEELYRLGNAMGKKKELPNYKSGHSLRSKSNMARRSLSHKESHRNSKDRTSHRDLHVNKNVIGRDILQQKTNPLIELMFEKSESSQSRDSCPSSPSKSPDHSKKDQKGKLDTLQEIQSGLSGEEDSDQNNNKQKELSPRQSKIVDQLFENRRNRIEEFRLMGSSNPDNSQIFESNIDSKEGKVNGHRGRKLFSFNFRRKSPAKLFESNLERPTSLQNLHDIRYAENSSRSMIEDYRRPSSLQRLNEASYPNSSIFNEPKKVNQKLEHSNALHKLHGTFSKTQSSLLGRDMRGATPLDVRQRSASLDQFHRREPIMLTRNTSFLHSRSTPSQSVSNESTSTTERTVKRSRSLIQRIFPMGRSKKNERKKLEDQEKALREMESHHSASLIERAESRRQMPLPNIPSGEIPESDYTSDLPEGIYEELDSIPSPKFSDESRVPSAHKKSVKVEVSMASGSSADSSGASSGYCTKIATPDVDYFTDPSESLVYDIPRSTSTSGPTFSLSSRPLNSPHEKNVRSLLTGDDSVNNLPRPPCEENVRNYLNIRHEDNVRNLLNISQEDNVRKYLNTPHEENVRTYGNSRFFLDFVDSLEANRMRLLRNPIPLEPDSLESSCSSDDGNRRYIDNAHEGYSSDDEELVGKAICLDSLLPLKKDALLPAKFVL